MADRVVIVQLKAIVSDYKRGMLEAAKATDQVAARGAVLAKTGEQMAAAGRQITTHVTLPVAGASVAVGKLAVDFDRSFSRMVGLAGVAGSEVDGLRESVADLAVEAGRGPNDVAEGLYFIRSAGLAGATAMETLEASAKGATAGLGSTAVVADAATSAIGAYGEENITAAHAVDVLVATAREGKAEASSLAPEFGRLLPVAAELGITFDQIGGGIAFLSRSSGDAALAGTQLLGVIQKFLEPGEEGAKALRQIGMSADELRANVRDKGLLPALTDLRSELEANGLELGDFSRDQQFLQGALQLTGVQAGDAREVFDALANSTGSLGTAFDAARSSKGFEISQDLARLQVEAIGLGDKLVPIGSDVIHVVTGIVDVFGDLPSPVQDALIVLTLLAAAGGPLIAVGGRVLQVWGKMGPELAKLPGGLQSAIKGIAGVTAVAAAGATAVELWMNMMDRARAAGQAWVSDADKAFSTIGSAGQARSELANLDAQIEGLRSKKRGSQALWDVDKRASMAAQISGGETLAATMRKELAHADKLARQFGLTADQAFALVQRQRALGVESTGAAQGFEDLEQSISPEKQHALAAAMHLTADQERMLFSASTSAASGLDTLGSSADTTALSIDEVASQIQQLQSEASQSVEPLFGLIDALDANRAAREGVTRAERDAAEAHRAVGVAERGAADAADQVAAAQAKVNAALAETADTSQAATDGITALQAAIRGTTDPLFAMLDALDANDKARAKAAEVAVVHHDEFGNPTTTPEDRRSAGEDVARTAAGVEVAAAGLAGAIQAGQISVAAAVDSLGEWVAAGLLTAEQAAVLASRFDEAAAAATRLEGANVASSIATATAAAQQKTADKRASDLAAANNELADAIDGQADANEKVVAAKGAAVDADRQVVDANGKVARSALDVELAAIAVATAIRNGVVDVDDAKASLRAWADEGLITEAQARTVAAQFDEVAAKAGALTGQTITMTLTLDTAMFDQALAERGWVFGDGGPGSIPPLLQRPPVGVLAPPTAAPPPSAGDIAHIWSGTSSMLSGASVGPGVINNIDNRVDRSIHDNTFVVDPGDTMGDATRRLERMSVLGG